MPKDAFCPSAGPHRGVPLRGDGAYRQTVNGAGRSQWSILSLRPADALHEPTNLPDVPIRAGELQSSSSANATEHHTRLVALLCAQGRLNRSQRHKKPAGFSRRV
jgi:hypothetical protein